jgi:peroxiredoxin
MSNRTKNLAIAILVALLPTTLLWSQKTTYINCQIKNLADKSVMFTTAEGIFKTNLVDTVCKIVDKKVSYSTSILSPTTVRVTHDFRYFDVYCEPGDTINLAFDADIYPTEINFTGTPHAAAHNRMLHALRQQFLYASNKIILEKINTTPALTFRKFMDDQRYKKWDFYHNLPAADKAAATPDFRQFLYAEIEYWYASNLLRYREEHTSLVSGDNIYLPDAYFDFLNNVLINNENAFFHSYYRAFLKSYADFRKIYPDFTHGLASRQILVRAKNNDTPIYLNMDCAKEIGTVDNQQNLMVVDKASFNSNNINKFVAYRVKVITQDGRTGWVRSFQCEQLNNVNQLNKKPLFIDNMEVAYKKDVTDCIVTQDKLSYLLDPANKKEEYSLEKETRLDYFSEMTTESLSYSNGGSYFSAPYSKVRDKYGVIGWVPTSGVRLHYYKADIAEWRSRVAENSQTPYYNFDYFFYGKPLYYVFGNEIREQIAFNGKAAVGDAYGLFLRTCKNEDLKTELMRLYKEEDKKYTIDSVSLARTEMVIDNRSSSINKRINQFELALEDFKAPTEPITPQQKSDKGAGGELLAFEGRSFNPATMSKTAKTAKKQVKPTTFKEPTFPAVKYEYRPTVFKITEKTAQKYNLNLSFVSDDIAKTKKNLLFKRKKAKRFLSSDTLVYELNLVEPVRGILTTKIDSQNIWVEPKQTFYIKEQNNKLILVGEGSAATVFLQEQAKINNRSNGEIAVMMQKDFSEFKEYLDKKHKERKSFLTEYNKKTNLPLQLLHAAEFDNEYWYFNQLFDYPMINKTYRVDTAQYYEFTREIKVQNDRALQSEEYKKFVKKYLDFQIKINALLDLPDNEIARLTYSSRTLKYWQVSDIAAQLKKNGLDEDLLGDVQKFYDDCNFPVVTDAMKNVFAQQTLSRGGYHVPAFSYKNLKNETVKSADFKNKVIVMYFWNSKQVDFEKNLKNLYAVTEKYKNNNVVFLKINTDNSPITWRKKVKKFGKDKYQLYGNDLDTYTKNLYEYFDATKPTTIVVSKKGNLAKNFEDKKIDASLLDFLNKEVSKR